MEMDTRMKVGEIFGFPVYTHPDLPPGEVALVGVGSGLEVSVEGRELVLRRRVTVARVINVLRVKDDTCPAH